MDPQNKDQLEEDKLEVSVEGEEKPEIVVIDDVPPEDRNRKPLAKDALAEDDEATEYSEKIKKRLGELRHQAHDERRAKEAALRERDEATRLAKAAYEKAKQLEHRLTHGEATFAEEYGNKAQLALEAAKAKHRTAYEAADSDKLAEAMAEIAEATQQMTNAKRWQQEARAKVERSALQQEEDNVESQAQSHQTQTVAADPDAVAWTKKNSWFGSDPAMTSLAYGVHEQLIRSGVDPRKNADQYYAAIDSEMRRRFPEYEWNDDDADDTGRATKPRKPAAPIVAPVTRTTSGNKNKVVLTQTQVRMAEKLGLTLEQYARELHKLNQGA